MKRVLSYAVIMIAIVASYSCKKDVPAELKVTTAELSFTKDGGNQNITFSANRDWTASSSASWVKVTPSGSSGATSISVTAEANAGYDDRTATITVKVENLSETVTVKQSANTDLAILVSKTEYSLSSEAQSIEVEVKHNVEYEVVIDEACKGWISVASTKGLSTDKVTLQIAKNGTYGDRTGKITVKQKNGTLSGVVTVKQSQNNGLIIGKTEYSLSSEAQSIEVEVKHNVEYEVLIDEACKGWISVASTKGLTTDKVTLQIAKNGTYGDRTGKITVKQKNGTLSGVVTVKQSQNNGLIIETREYSAPCTENQITVEVIANVDFEVISNVDWIKHIKTKALNASSVVLKVSQNQTFVQRTGTVRIKQKNGSLESVISIIQEGDTQITIPDADFRAYCIAHFDTNSDGKMSKTEASAVESIYISGPYAHAGTVKSLEGIEHFIALETLDCSCNQLTILDLSKNTALNKLNCDCNQLTSLDVSKNSALTTLWCYDNQMTSLDVSKNPALNSLDCSGNQLTSLDVSKSTALNSLDCSNNQLTSLDVSKNPALELLLCNQNQLTSLDVSKSTALNSLDCSNNQLTSLDVSKNPALEYLYCYGNQLISLDVSKNTALKLLLCNQNQLTSLDVSKNTALEQLWCPTNQLTSLDVSKNTALKLLLCNQNQLTSLDVSKNIALTQLWCSDNPNMTELWLKTGQAIDHLSKDDHTVLKYKD